MGISWLGASSVLLVIAVVLFLAIPRFFQRNSVTSIAAERFAEDICLDSHTGLSGEPLSHTVLAADTPTWSVSSRPARVARSQSQPEEARYTIYWGRVLIFGLGLVAFLTAFLSALFALFSSSSWLVPVTSFLVALACIATLRAFALHDEKKRGRRRLAQNPQPQTSHIVLQPAQESEAAPQKNDFLREESPVRLKPKPSEDQQPVSFAAKSLRYARTHHQPERLRLEGTAKKPLRDRRLPEVPFESSVLEWQPTPLPEPIYTDFELVQPENTKFMPEAFKIPEPPTSQGAPSSNSLDDILSRRRRP